MTDKFILLHRVLDARPGDATTYVADILVELADVRSIERVVCKPADSPANTILEYHDNACIVVTETFEEVAEHLDHHTHIGFGRSGTV